MASGNVAVLIVRAAPTTIWYVLVVSCVGAWLVTLIVKPDVPEAVGVPLISPAVDRLRPAGRLPEDTDHVSGGSPLAVNCTEYDEPTAAEGRDGFMIASNALIVS